MALYPLVDCLWSKYDEWSICSVSCGRGIRTSKRYIVKEAENNGKNCTGYGTRTETCATAECPKPGTVFNVLLVHAYLLSSQI